MLTKLHRSYRHFNDGSVRLKPGIAGKLVADLSLPRTTALNAISIKIYASCIAPLKGDSKTGAGFEASRIFLACLCKVPEEASPDGIIK